MYNENVLEDLYYGNINPSEKHFDRDSEYAKLVEIISVNEKKLTDFLNGLSAADKERHLFSQLINAQGEIAVFNESERFMEGFKLGAKFILDTFIINHRSVVKDIH